MPADEGVTLGELNRNISALRAELAATRAELAAVHELRTRAELNKVGIAQANDRIDELEDALRWVTRLVIGAVVLALLGLVVSAAGR